MYLFFLCFWGQFQVERVGYSESSFEAHFHCSTTQGQSLAFMLVCLWLSLFTYSLHPPFLRSESVSIMCSAHIFGFIFPGKTHRIILCANLLSSDVNVL